MIKLYKKFERKPFTNIAYTFLGIFYVAMPYALLNIAAFESGTYNFEIIFGCLLFCGRVIPAPTLPARCLVGASSLSASLPRSHGKALGGAVLAFVFAFIMQLYFSVLAPWQWYCVAAIIIVGGIYGDLIESLLKRSIEIKDSGSILPGHGGFLPRSV